MDVVLSKKKAGRPLLFGNEIDKKVQDYLRMLQKKGGILNSVVIDEDEHLKCIDLENTEWACSLFLRIGFERRAATTGRWKIPDGAIKEAGLLFHNSIIDIVHRYQIPPPLIMNFDQTLDKKKCQNRCNLRVVVPESTGGGIWYHIFKPFLTSAIDIG